tara:strand:- start:23517 stop:23945 length:429 start_codon:yes stop_codon:yes gene_type:complete
MNSKEKTAKKEQKSKSKQVSEGIKLRGRIFVGTVTASKMQKTVTVEWERKGYLKKYERYEKKKSRIKAHNPESISAKEGDIVRIMECRPLSKTKNFVVVEVLGKEKGFKERMEAEEESKFKREEEKEELKSDNQEDKAEVQA